MSRVNVRLPSYSTASRNCDARRPWAATTRGTRIASNARPPTSLRTIAPSQCPLVSHRIENRVDADRVSSRRELIEVARVLAFALPGIGDVGIVRHQHQDVAV